MSIADVNAARAGQDGTVAAPDGPRAGRPKRRTFTAEYKLLLEEYENAEIPGDRRNRSEPQPGRLSGMG